MSRSGQLRAIVSLLGLAMLIAAVVAMHSMGAGHSPGAGTGTPAAHAAGHGPAAGHSEPVAAGDTGPCGECLAQLVPVGDPHAMAAMCLAVLTGLVLLMVGRLLARGRARSPLARDRRRNLAPGGRAPPGLLAPSLSQLGVLRV